jgi:hypothetical protein
MNLGGAVVPFAVPPAGCRSKTLGRRNPSRVERKVASTILRR